jgi:hypothetical protein
MGKPSATTEERQTLRLNRAYGGGLMLTRTVLL